MDKVSNNIKNIKVSLFKQILSFLIMLIGFELILYFEDNIIWISIGQLLVLITLCLWILKFKLSIKETYFKLIIPLLFYLGSLAFYILVPSKTFAHIYIFAVSFLTLLIIRNIRNVKKYSENKELFNMNDIYLLVTAFLICSGIFGIYIFLYLPMWLLLLASLVFISMLIFQFFWSEGIISRKNIIYIPILALVFTEITWALSFWPTGFASRGIVLFVIFYFIIGIIKLHLNNRFHFKSIQKYIYVTIIVLALVLGTTKWFY